MNYRKADFLNLLSLFTIYLSGFYFNKIFFYQFSIDAPVDTSYILDVFGIVFGFCYILLAFLIFRNVFAKIDKKYVRYTFIASLLLMSLDSSANLLLFSANNTGFSVDYLLSKFVDAVVFVRQFYLYIFAVYIVAVSCLHFIGNKQKLKALGTTSDIVELRLRRASSNKSRNFLLFNSVFMLFLVANIAYWDLIGSQPPRLSEAKSVFIEEDGLVHLPINKQLLDGNLHRFLWSNDQGDTVRFFVINKNKSDIYLSVTLDACIMCGNHGYIQDGDNLFCSSCGVMMVKQSVGKAGGCNPIPIAFNIDNSEILLSESDLLNSAALFR